MPKIRTGAAFDKYVARQLGSKQAREQFARDAQRLVAVGRLMAAFDEARNKRQLSKAELARRMHKQAPAVSRLLRAEDSNPTISTILEVCEALDLHMRVVLERRHAKKVDLPLEVVASYV